MHIPDGYLSPATCITLFGGSAPFWYIALRRMKRTMHTQALPLLSLMAAFSFLVMMFNLPLPGGTTGHAVGESIAAIVLGPWGAILSVSTAIFIQAFLFGDGGVTAIGANCFNMAIVASLVAYATYRALAGNAPIDSRRRVIAAGAAGYLSINVAALLTAIEFGLQPLLYHDAAGSPLYAPYPLQIAIPAMMLGHLTLAGPAEMIVAAGVVSYLQKTDPELLRSSASSAWQGKATNYGWRQARPLWAALGLLMLATPLGVLAGGSAWGEWSAHNFAEPEARQAIAAVSGNHPLPAGIPEGINRLSAFWTAPIPGYAPPFMKSLYFGYILSAMAGTGIIILGTLLAARVFSKRD